MSCLINHRGLKDWHIGLKEFKSLCTLCINLGALRGKKIS